jgi:primosomal protein N'
MPAPYANVALPVPLRTLFTYSVPEPLRDTLRPGARVLVPFRKKSLVGVIVEFTDAAPTNTQIRPITKSLDFTPALTPKLIELAQWLAGYYIAPIGEVFRSMLPPLVELKTDRRVAMTQAGSDLIAAHGETLQNVESADNFSLQSLATHHSPLATPLSIEEAKFLIHLYMTKSPIQPRPSDLKTVIPALQRRGFIEIRETIQSRQRKTHRIVAWKSPDFSALPTRALNEKNHASANFSKPSAVLSLWLNSSGSHKSPARSSTA